MMVNEKTLFKTQELRNLTVNKHCALSNKGFWQTVLFVFNIVLSLLNRNKKNCNLLKPPSGTRSRASNPVNYRNNDHFVLVFGKWRLLKWSLPI